MTLRNNKDNNEIDKVDQNMLVSVWWQVVFKWFVPFSWAVVCAYCLSVHLCEAFVLGPHLPTKQSDVKFAASLKYEIMCSRGCRFQLFLQL